jgi:putative hydrolase of the HAD superfamily
LKLIAWDFDGVLNRGHQGGFVEWQRSFEAELGTSAAAFTDFIYAPDRFAKVLTGQRDLLDLLAEYTAAHAVPHTAQAVLDHWLAKDAVPDDQVLAWAKACRVPCVIATNNETHRATHIWTTLGYSAHMQRIFASGRMGVRKPDPVFFQQIETWSGHAPDQILLIDDAEKNIAAAAARGGQVFHFTDKTRAGLPQRLGLTP